MIFLVSVLGLFLWFHSRCMAQVHGFGGGVSLSSGVDFNYGSTGNPGIILKGWLALDKGSMFHITSSMAGYSTYRKETSKSLLTNYMFHGDLDLQFTFYQDGSLNTAVFGGANFTYLKSFYTHDKSVSNPPIKNASGYAPGVNLGAALEMHVAPKWDFNVSGKYVISRYHEFIISVQSVYYFKRMRNRYRR